MNLRASKNPARDSYNIRIFLFLLGVGLLFSLIALRLFFLQIGNRDYYRALASDQHGFEKEILPKRGEIYFTSNINSEAVLAATNVVKNLVYAVPKEIDDPNLVAEKLSLVLQMPIKDIENKILNGSENYVALKKQLSDEEVAVIKSLKLAGLAFEPETIRVYPEKKLASQVLGFLGYKGNLRAGQYGIEGKFEESLAGSKGIVGLEKDRAGRWITFVSRNFIPSTDGDDIYLTIDSAIQFKAEQVLNAAISKHGAESGSVIVIDPKTGSILAMANAPDFDPNEYGKVASLDAYNNSGVSLDYEPGSVFKPITMAAAINEGAVTPETVYEDVGKVLLDDREIRNSDYEAHGIQTMTQVLEKSLNTGAVFVEQKLGHEKFRKYVKKFGFGKVLGIDLPGEVAGNIENVNKKSDVFFGTAAYGQGITTTALQLITAYSALANGGNLMQPYVVKSVIHPDRTKQDTYPKVIDKVLDPKTAATVSAMMVNVVENGHGKQAGVKGYYIAGKTGTAQVPFKDRSGYDPSKSIGSFIGFGPADNPKFLMLVRISNPKDVKFAESTAAPAFGQIASFILNYLQIPPTR